MRIDSTRLTLGFILAAVVGCSPPPPSAPAPTPVKGKVFYAGKPLTKGALIFEPEIGGGDVNADIQPDGTFETKSPNGQGMPAGPYRVYVSGLNKSQIPLKYHNPSSSKTTIDVKPEQSEYTIEFK